MIDAPPRMKAGWSDDRASTEILFHCTGSTHLCRRGEHREEEFEIISTPPRMQATSDFCHNAFLRNVNVPSFTASPASLLVSLLLR